MTSNRKKENPNYELSAINLCNPLEVKEILLAQQNRKLDLTRLQEKIDACIPPELKAELECLQNEIATEDKGLRGYIDTFGSYQDVEAGIYAVKQLKRTKLYSATNFESCFPEYATAVLTKSVNVPVLEGLIKGNLLSEEGLRRAHIIEDKETFAYIIK